MLSVWVGKLSLRFLIIKGNNLIDYLGVDELENIVNTHLYALGFSEIIYETKSIYLYL